ncbi:YhjD/YihY/BrkB family envelope integrity protein [Dactylosporangium sp. NPDC005555]|uniref:YhjD/YihY/BrkB family envelope integrity protein n=1 Tax=Dactylosporangium sp. NPDC005555 TaxID=3154889 RepID=UPI0033ABE47F
MRVVRVVLLFFRGRDLNLHAAAVTFYGAVAVVPVALLTVRLAGLIAGAGRIRDLAGPVIAAMPDRLGAGRATAVLVDAGLGMSWPLTLIALVPATWYGEGLRRAFVSLTESGSPAGWRGRLLILPVLAAAPALLLGLLLVLPGAARRLQDGGWSSVAAVVVSFLATWLALSPAFVMVYRWCAPPSPAWAPTVAVGAFTAANVSGFAHGFVLFWSLPLDLGAPFGGLDAIGAVVAVLLWLYVFHLLTLIGYGATLQAARWWALRSAAS